MIITSLFDLWPVFVVVIAFICTLFLSFSSIKRYEIAVLLVAFSPWISAIFIPNAPRTIGVDETNLGSYLRISILILMGSVGLIRFMKSWLMHKYIPDYGIIILSIFLLLAIFSTAYSIEKEISLIRSFTFLAFFLFLLGLNDWIKKSVQMDQIINILYIQICFFLVGSIITIFLFPEKAWHWNALNRFRGLWNHPNTMGSFCMVSYPILLWKYSRHDKSKKWYPAFVILTCFVLHLLTGSRGSLFASMLGIAIWFLVLKKNINFILYLAGMLILLSFIIILKPERFQREHDSGDVTYLTGRTDFWKGALILIQERPVMGYGYAVEGSVWNDPRFYDPKLGLWRGSSKTSIHNGYLSITIGMGLVGLVLWSVILFLPFWKYLYLKSSMYKAVVISAMSMLFILNFIESAISDGRSFAAVVFWIVWVMGSKLKEMETEIY